MLLRVPGLIVLEPEVLPVATASQQQCRLSHTALQLCLRPGVGKDAVRMLQQQTAKWMALVQAGILVRLPSVVSLCPGIWKLRKQLSVVAVRGESALVNAAFGAACLVKVVCVLFELGSHPVIETGWVRWLAKCEGKKKVKIPKQYQGKTNNNNSNTNKRNNNKTLIFFLVCIRDFGKPESYSTWLFPG